MSRVMLVDADVVVFQMAAIHQDVFQWDEDTRSVAAYEAEAKKGVFREIKKLKNRLGIQDVKIILSDTTNFRYSVLPTYKHNRKDKERPLLIQALRQHLLDNFDCVMMPNLEGDDALGILSTEDPGASVIVSIDKDMKTIPGWLYNPMRDEEGEGLVEVSMRDALLFHLEQTLTGDQVDGYKGCPRIGPVKAAEALSIAEYLTLDEDNPSEFVSEIWEHAILPLYEKKGLAEEDALVQAQVAHILWANDYNKDSGEITLWHPQFAPRL